MSIEKLPILGPESNPGVPAQGPQTSVSSFEAVSTSTKTPEELAQIRQVSEDLRGGIEKTAPNGSSESIVSPVSSATSPANQTFTQTPAKKFESPKASLGLFGGSGTFLMFLLTSVAIGFKKMGAAIEKTTGISFSGGGGAPKSSGGKSGGGGGGH